MPKESPQNSIVIDFPEDLYLDSQLNALRLGHPFSKYARLAIDVYNDVCELEPTPAARIITHDSVLPLPRRSLPTEPEPTVPRTLNLGNERIAILRERARKGNAIPSQRVHKSLRLANYLLSIDARPLNLAKDGLPENIQTIVW